jgi:hypothetical protein
MDYEVPNSTRSYPQEREKSSIANNTGEISNEMDTLFKRADILHAKIESLGGRLQPLFPDLAEKKDGTDGADGADRAIPLKEGLNPVSPLGRELRNLLHLLDGADVRLAKILDRLVL